MNYQVNSAYKLCGCCCSSESPGAIYNVMLYIVPRLVLTGPGDIVLDLVGFGLKARGRLVGYWYTPRHSSASSRVTRGGAWQQDAASSSAVACSTHQRTQIPARAVIPSEDGSRGWAQASSRAWGEATRCVLRRGARASSWPESRSVEICGSCLGWDSSLCADASASCRVPGAGAIGLGLLIGGDCQLDHDQG